jgi:hypothetical protein
VVFDLSNGGKRYLNDLTIGAFYLNAWSGERLRGFHAPDNASHSLAVNRNYLNIVFAIQRLQGRQCFGYFHVFLIS